MPSSTVSDKLFMTVLIAVVGLLKNTTFSGEEPIGKNPKRYLRSDYWSTALLVLQYCNALLFSSTAV